MTTIFVTGSSGFVGKAVSNFLEDHGYNVHRLSRNEMHDPKILPHCHGKDNILIHCAWAGVLGQDRNSPMQSDNLRLARSIVEISKRLHVRKLIAFGSQAEYGNPNKRVTEESPLNPTTRYGEAKIECHNLLAESCASEGMALIWLRLFDPYGPGDNPAWFIPYVIRSALDNKAPSLTECTQLWDYVFIDDVCRCILSIVSSPCLETDVYNLSSDSPVRLRKVVDFIFSHVKDCSCKPLYGAVEYRQDQVFYLQGSNKKLFLSYGWIPLTDMHTGLLKTIDYFSSLH